MTSYVIKSDISEKQLEADVASFLGWCSTGLPFKLVDVNEQLTGADKRLDVAIPVYIQFKKSTGLKQLPRAIGKTKASGKRRSNESKLQKVRRFRRDHMLSDDPSLYFQLRRKAETADDLQHNVLLSHNRPGLSYAIYVAPTYLTRREFNEELTKGPRFVNPWEMRQWSLHSDFAEMYWLSRYDRQPFLRNHVSITPHERVANHNHYYAFSTAGDEVSWHSPEVLEGRHSRLSDFMSIRARELLSGEATSAPEEIIEHISEITAGFAEVPIQQFLFGETPLEQLQSYGRWLNKSWGIRQILLCANREDLSSLFLRTSY
ncbi:hypothetical protein [Ruegeria faecimaris]|nr:hypothetical protein [Ruegeria faecimaris]